MSLGNIGGRWAGGGGGGPLGISSGHIRTKTSIQWKLDSKVLGTEQFCLLYQIFIISVVKSNTKQNNNFWFHWDWSNLFVISGISLYITSLYIDFHCNIQATSPDFQATGTNIGVKSLIFGSNTQWTRRIFTLWVGKFDGQVGWSGEKKEDGDWPKFGRVGLLHQTRSRVTMKVFIPFAYQAKSMKNDGPWRCTFFIIAGPC